MVLLPPSFKTSIRNRLGNVPDARIQCNKGHACIFIRPREPCKNDAAYVIIDKFLECQNIEPEHLASVVDPREMHVIIDLGKVDVCGGDLWVITTDESGF